MNIKIRYLLKLKMKTLKTSNWKLRNVGHKTLMITNQELQLKEVKTWY